MAQDKKQVLRNWVKANYPKFQDRLREMRIICEASDSELDFMLAAIQ